MKTIDKARLVISRTLAKEGIESIKREISDNRDDWFKISAKAYELWLQSHRKENNEIQKKPNVSATSNEKIKEILLLNEKLCDFALCLPTISTQADVSLASDLLNWMPGTEVELLSLIGHMTLHPRIRALQNIGRIRHFQVFKNFSHIVESATLCYYRGNYVSSYLTLIPVIEGVLLRWSGYDGEGNKPDFEEIRRFFSFSHVRQPCPANPLFHEIFSKACQKIINEHLYKHSQDGSAYSEFNRHLAAHLIRDTEFATQANCIRIFLLLDTMAEIYLYETSCEDPRWSLTNLKISRELEIYTRLDVERQLGGSAESVLLNGF